MAVAAPTLTADAGTIPFEVLSLIGRARADLPGAWQAVEAATDPVPFGRMRYAARGRAGADAVPLEVRARLFQGRVWAVGIATPGFLLQVQHGPDGHAYLAAVPRPPGVPPELINWISRRGDEYFDLGLAP